MMTRKPVSLQQDCGNSCVVKDPDGNKVCEYTSYNDDLTQNEWDRMLEVVEAINAYNPNKD